MADQKQVRVLAYELMRQHDLHGWVFKFDRAKTRFGYCRYGSKRISMSEILLPQLTMDQARNTLLHEIAHALTPGDRHGRRWQAVAKSIGCDGMRVGPVIKETGHKYTLYCEAGHEFGRHRKTKGRVACPICCVDGKFNPDHLLSWRQNY